MAERLHFGLAVGPWLFWILGVFTVLYVTGWIYAISDNGQKRRKRREFDEEWPTTWRKL